MACARINGLVSRADGCGPGRCGRDRCWAIPRENQETSDVWPCLRSVVEMRLHRRLASESSSSSLTLSLSLASLFPTVLRLQQPPQDPPLLFSSPFLSFSFLKTFAWTSVRELDAALTRI